MKYNYPQLEGLCKDCLYKCNRVEDINFKGVYRCEYYVKEQKKNEQVQK